MFSCVLKHLGETSQLHETPTSPPSVLRNRRYMHPVVFLFVELVWLPVYTIFANVYTGTVH